MNFLDYTCFVEGLASDSSKVDFNARLTTAILGLTGEAAECVELMISTSFDNKEFNRTKLIDELSDMMWYVAFGTIALETSLVEMIQKSEEFKAFEPPAVSRNPTSNNNDILEEVMRLSCSAGHCADITKKYLFHSKPFNKEKFLESLSNVVLQISKTAALLGLTIQEVVDVNVVKLKDRYKTGKFTFEEFMKKEVV